MGSMCLWNPKSLSLSLGFVRIQRQEIQVLIESEHSFSSKFLLFSWEDLFPGCGLSYRQRIEKATWGFGRTTWIIMACGKEGMSFTCQDLPFTSVLRCPLPTVLPAYSFPLPAHLHSPAGDVGLGMAPGPQHAYLSSSCLD